MPHPLLHPARDATPAPTPAKIWVALSVVVLTFVALACVVALRTPPWEAADEPGHVQDVETLVRAHWYAIPSTCSFGPRVSPFFACAGTEPQQAPLYYLALAGWQKLMGIPPQPPFRGTNDLARYFSPRGPFLAQDQEAEVGAGYVRWLRAPNVVLGALTLFVTFFAVRDLTSDPWSPVVATAVLASVPRFVFLSAVVTNDDLVALLGACLTLAAIRFMCDPAWWRMAIVGGVFGLLITTKLSTIPMGITIVVIAYLVKAGWTRRLQLAAIGTGTSLLVSSWYLIANTVRYGDPLALHASVIYLQKVVGLGTLNDQPYVVTDPLGLVFVRVPQRIVASLWYQSGWGQFNWPLWIDWVITVMVIALVLSLFARPHYRRSVLMLGAIVASGLLCVWVTAFQTATYQGRYAIGGLPSLAALLALALDRWRLPLRFVLPILGVIGTIVALYVDVLAVQWT